MSGFDKRRDDAKIRLMKLTRQLNNALAKARELRMEVRYKIGSDQARVVPSLMVDSWVVHDDEPRDL